tara:strand:+ start:337 stop:1176 length:840 start_codon:yes stop_codon:yes gene_type:complete
MAIQTTQNLPAPYIESELKAFLPQAGKAGATDTTSALGLPSLAAESAFTGQGRKAGAAQAGLTYDPTSNVLGAGTGVAAYEPYLTKAAQYADPANISAFETPQQNYAIQAMQDEQARQQGQLSNAALQSGAFGGGRHGVAQGQLSAQGAQDIGLFKNDMYNQAMQNMFQASGMQQGLGEQTQQQGIANAALLNQLGAGQLGYSQAGLDTSAQAAEMKRQEPFNRLGWYGGQLSQLMGGMPNPYMQTSPEQSSASPFMQALASGAGAYGLGGMLGKMWGS